MNHDDVVKMGYEAGLCDEEGNNDAGAYIGGNLMDFAILVSAYHPSDSPTSFHEGIAAGTSLAREACAQLCDHMEKASKGVKCCEWPTPADCAAAIRSMMHDA